MATEKLRTAVRREQIAAAALELAATHGLRRLSIAAVARRVGLVPSAVYRHFRGKGEILDAMLDLIRGRLLRNVAAVCAETADPATRLERLLMRHIELVRENQGMPRILLSEDMASGDPQHRTRLYGSMRRYLGEIARIIEDGQRRGQFAAGFDPDTAAVLFLGLVMPPVILWHMSDGAFDVTRQARRAWPLFLQALRSPKGPGGGRPATVGHRRPMPRTR